MIDFEDSTKLGRFCESLEIEGWLKSRRKVFSDSCQSANLAAKSSQLFLDILGITLIYEGHLYFEWRYQEKKYKLK